MIAGIGTDILRIKNLSRTCLRSGDPFLEKTYSEEEIRAAAAREIPFYYYATRFAGKEAVFKALRISPEHVKMSEIEILNDENGAPQVKLYGNLLAQAVAKGITCIHISLSYEEEYACAMAVAERGESPAHSY